MQPINYMPQNQPDLMKNFLSGLQTGSAISDIQAKRQEYENALKLKEQYSKDAQELFKNPTADALGQFAIKYPTNAEKIISAGKLITDAQKETAFNDASKIYNSISNGNVDYAKNLLDTKIQAFQNSGKDASDYLELKAQLDRDPKVAATTAGFIASSLDPEKFLKINKAPSEVSEAKSKADKAAIESKFAESNAVLDIQKKGWDVTKIQEDIKIAKENSRIAALNAQISREGNSLKRQEMGLKLQEMQDKRDEAIRGKTSEVESARFNIDNMLNTADRVLKNKSLNSVLGSIQGRLPALVSDEANDAIALIDTLGSQAFLSQIPNVKGMGALSNAEGEKLQSALQNLSRKQSEKQFKENLNEAQRLMLKARKNISTRFGVPETTPDTPAVQPSTTDIDSILKKYGGQ
jgi:hypothetical protein